MTWLLKQKNIFNVSINVNVNINVNSIANLSSNKVIVILINKNLKSGNFNLMVKIVSTNINVNSLVNINVISIVDLLRVLLILLFNINKKFFLNAIINSSIQ